MDRGGTALFFAHLLDLMGAGEVVGVDTDLGRLGGAVLEHSRITLRQGSSTDPHIVDELREMSVTRRTMVVLDSDHSAKHVNQELRLYCALVTPGCYLIVEDTNINGHPALAGYGPGPYEAVQDFLESHREFVADHECEKFMLTFSPSGFLRRLG